MASSKPFRQRMNHNWFDDWHHKRNKWKRKHAHFIFDSSIYTWTNQCDSMWFNEMLRFQIWIELGIAFSIDFDWPGHQNTISISFQHNSIIWLNIKFPMRSFNMLGHKRRYNEFSEPDTVITMYGAARCCHLFNGRLMIYGKRILVVFWLWIFEFDDNDKEIDKHIKRQRWIDEIENER